MNEEYYEYHFSKETLRILRENKLNGSWLLETNNNSSLYLPIPKNPNPDMPNSIGDLEEEIMGP